MLLNVIEIMAAVAEAVMILFGNIIRGFTIGFGFWIALRVVEYLHIGSLG